MVQAIVDWFTPKRQLVFFCLFNFFNYMDKTVVSSSENYFDKFISKVLETETTGVYFGLLTSIFIVGFTIAGVIFAYLLRFNPPMRVIGFGFIIHTVSLVLSGVSYYADSYLLLVVARGFSGVGEAGFVMIAPALIEESAPAATKATWIAIFSVFVPIGQGAGYMLGSSISKQLGWQWAFFLQIIPFIPGTILCFLMDEVKLSTSDDSAYDHVLPEDEKRSEVNSTVVSCADEAVGNLRLSMKLLEQQPKTPSDGIGEKRSFIAESMIVLSNPLFLLTAIGQGFAQFTVVGVSIFASSIVRSLEFTTSHTSAAFMVGGIAIIGGLVGAMLGGFLIDRIGGKNPAKKLQASVSQLVFTTLGGAVLLMIAPWMTSSAAFFVLVLVGLTVTLCYFTPTMIIYMSAVPLRSKGLALGIASFIFHFLGDVPAGIVVGAIIDALAPPHTVIAELEDNDKLYNDEGKKGLRWSLFITMSVLLLALASWVAGYFVFKARMKKNAELAQKVVVGSQSSARAVSESTPRREAEVV